MNIVMIWQTSSTNSADTERLGEQLGKLLQPPSVIELRSDLGGGKTTFTRGLVRGLGSTDKVSSPTFTLNKVYKVNNLEIHHFDFFRLNEPGLVADQLSESLEDSKVITVVEWSDIVAGVLPKDRLTIDLKPTKLSADERAIKISYPVQKESLIMELQTSMAESKP